MIRYKISKIWALRWTLSWPRPRSSGGALHCSLLFWWERMRYMALRHTASHLVFAPPPPCSSSSSLFRWCCHPKTPPRQLALGIISEAWGCCGQVSTLFVACRQSSHHGLTLWGGGRKERQTDRLTDSPVSLLIKILGEWAHLNLITSQMLHLQIPWSHWGLGL